LLSRQTLDSDLRYYTRIASTGVLAFRLRGFSSFGGFPGFTYFGGNSEMHGYPYLSFIGQNAIFGDAELRFPIIEAALTPIGVVGGVRGLFFANVGGAWFNSQSFKFWSSKPETVTPVLGYQTSTLTGAVLTDLITGAPLETLGAPETISGFRLEDGRASYGLGLETFAFGFPIHFDWAWRTLFNQSWENYVFASSGGSAAFRKPQFEVWIGYDF
jgi:outer membrane protein assembly factor BamA